VSAPDYEVAGQVRSDLASRLRLHELAVNVTELVPRLLRQSLEMTAKHPRSSLVCTAVNRDDEMRMSGSTPLGFLSDSEYVSPLTGLAIGRLLRGLEDP
jgi:hypothetical protein